MSTSSLTALLAQRSELDRQIGEAKQAQAQEAKAKIRALMDEAGLTLADLSDDVRVAKGLRSGKPAKGGVAVKFRNASTGETWTGRGMQPRWLRAALEAGAKLDEFRVHA